MLAVLRASRRGGMELDHGHLMGLRLLKSESRRKLVVQSGGLRRVRSSEELLLDSLKDTNALMQDFVRLVESEKAMRAFPGISVTVIREVGGATEEFSHACGYSNLESLTAMTPDSLLRVASISKPITAMGVLKLVDEGKLRLDQTALDVLQRCELTMAELDKFPPLRALCEVATVEQLMSHCSGLSHYLENKEYTCTEVVHWQREALVRYGDERHIPHKPGERFLYSSYGYNMLGLIAEVVSGKPFDVFIKETLFDSLGMHNTRSEADEVFERSARMRERRSTQYEMHATAVSKDYKTVTTVEYVPAPPVEMSGKLPAGGFISTARDIALFTHIIHTGGYFTKEMRRRIYTGGSGKVVDTATVNGAPFDVRYGLGWRVRRPHSDQAELTPIERVAHTGGAVGGAAMAAHFPKHKLTVVTIANVQDGAVEKTMTRISNLFRNASF